MTPEHLGEDGKPQTQQCQAGKPAMVHCDVLCRHPNNPKSGVVRHSKHHTSSAQCLAEQIFDKQVVRLVKHQTDMSNYAYNKKRGVFINSQILCALYLWL